MDFEGNKVYLTIEEQRITGYSSPLDVTTFDLHAEREATDTELDRLTELCNSDAHELTSEERASAPRDMDQVAFKSSLLRAIAKETAQRTAAEELIEGTEEFLRNITK
jgi:hypothetical protein